MVDNALPKPWEQAVEPTKVKPWEQPQAIENKIDEGEPRKYGSLSEAALADIARFGPGQGAGIGVLEVPIAVASNLATTIGGGAASVPYLLDSNDAAKAVQDYYGQMGYQPRTAIGQYSMDKLGSAAESLQQLLRTPFAGLAGLGTLATGGGVENAVRNIEETKQRGPGSVAADAGAPPGVSTAFDVGEEAVYTLFGTKLPGTLRTRKDQAISSGMDIDARANPAAIADIPEGYGNLAARELDPGDAEIRVKMDNVDLDEAEAIKQSIASGDQNALINQADVNPELVRAFETLGIPYSLAMVAENPAFRQVQSALKSRPASGLEVVDMQTLKGLEEAAVKFSKQYGGTVDRADVDLQVRDEYNRIIDDMGSKEEVAYTKIENAIPQSARVPAEELTQLLVQKVWDLGAGDVKRGRAQLSPTERKAFDVLFDVSEDGTSLIGNDVSYASLNQLRKDVGSKMKPQMFSDEDQGLLKRLYGALAEDQRRVTSEYGIEGDYRAAADLTIQRKAMEQRFGNVYGKDGVGSVLKKVDQAARDLMNGNTSTLNQLIENTPEGKRRQVTVAVIDYLFRPGAATGTEIKAGFDRAINSLQKNEKAMGALFKGLPAKARKNFDNIANAYQGFYRSTLYDNKSRTALAVIQALEDAGVINKLTGKAGQVAGYATGGPVGSALIDAVQTGRAGRKAERRVESAAQLFASPTMRDAVLEYASETGKAARLAELEKSKVYREWLQSVDDATREAIAEYGLMGFLFGTLEATTDDVPRETSEEETQ